MNNNRSNLCKPALRSTRRKRVAALFLVLGVILMSYTLPSTVAEKKFIVVIDPGHGGSDPGNLGTIIRIADWFGVKNIVCSKQTADMYNPKVVQSTMASLQNVNILYTDLLPWLAANKGIPVLAATLGGKNLKSFTSIDEAIIIIGNESKGVQPQLLQMASDTLTIPRVGHAESLNAAVATGIILYELTR
jgi:tRNA G18 (ribose-2'-O)-methylase SpoU